MTSRPDPATLPPGQLRLYRAVVAHYARTGAAPSFRELIDELGYASTASVTCHLAPLAAKGFVVWTNRGRDTTARAIGLPGLSDVVRGFAEVLAAKIPDSPAGST